MDDELENYSDSSSEGTADPDVLDKDTLKEIYGESLSDEEEVQEDFDDGFGFESSDEDEDDIFEEKHQTIDNKSIPLPPGVNVEKLFSKEKPTVGRKKYEVSAVPPPISGSSGTRSVINKQQASTTNNVKPKIKLVRRKADNTQASNPNNVGNQKMG